MTARFGALRARNPLPKGTIPVGIGLAVTGIASYAFLVVSARALGPDAYSGLAVLWAAVYLIGPGLFIPLEQEVARLLAERRAHGIGSAPVVSRAAILGAGLAAIVIIAATALNRTITDHMFKGDVVLFLGLLVGVIGYYVANLAEGVLAGNARFARYGLYLGGEAVIRLGICIICVVVGASTPGPYGLALGIAPVLALIPSFIGVRGLMRPGPVARWRDLTMSLGALTTGSLFAQLLVNAPPLLAEILDRGDPATNNGTTVGAFTAALILARIPFFVFQAIQAALLPSLAGLVATQRFDQFWRILIRLVAVITAMAAVGVVIGFSVGSRLVGLFFGHDFFVSNRTVGMLALASSLYLVAMALAQAVIALAAPRFVAIGWGAGALVLVIVSMVGPAGLAGVEWGYAAGSATAVAVMISGLWMLWSRGARAHTPDVIEAAYDLALEP